MTWEESTRWRRGVNPVDGKAYINPKTGGEYNPTKLAKDTTERPGGKRQYMPISVQGREQFWRRYSAPPKPMTCEEREQAFTWGNVEYVPDPMIHGIGM